MWCVCVKNSIWSELLYSYCSSFNIKQLNNMSKKLLDANNILKYNIQMVKMTKEHTSSKIYVIDNNMQANSIEFLNFFY